MERVRELGCLIARLFPAQARSCSAGTQVHHITYPNRGQYKASHYETIPLCFNHHEEQSPLEYGEAVHKGTRVWEKKYGNQRDLLEIVRSLLDAQAR